MMLRILSSSSGRRINVAMTSGTHGQYCGILQYSTTAEHGQLQCSAVQHSAMSNQVGSIS